MSCGMPLREVQTSVVGPPVGTNLSFSRVDGIGSTRDESTLRPTRSILAMEPSNSHGKNAVLPSMAKSGWLMPPHLGASIEYCSAIVFGSRKSRRWRASATTMADLPSGVKYMLYGSSTGIALPGLPVRGSIGVRLPALLRSALLAAHSVRRS